MNLVSRYRESNAEDPRHLRPVKVRFAVLAFFFVMAAVLFPIWGLQSILLPLFFGITIVLISNFISFLWIVNGNGLQYRPYVAALFDILLITFVIHRFGGIESTVSWAYALVIIAYSLLHGLRVALYVAVVSSIMHSFLLTGEFLGIVPHISFDRINPIYLGDDPFYLSTKLLSDNLLFFISAGVSGILSDKLRQGRKELEDKNKLLQDKIEEGRLAELGLRNSEERLKILFEYAPDAYYLNDLEGTLLDGNKAAEEMTGYKKEELIGRNFLDLNLLSSDQIQKAARLLAENANGNPTGANEFVLTRNDGSKISAEITTYPVEINDQTMVLGIARDVTDRKCAEEALAESENRHRILAENAKDMIWAMDLETLRFTYVSPSVKEMRGYTVEEAMGQRLDEAVTPASFKIAVNALAGELSPDNVQRVGSDWSRTIELEQTCKDGSTKWVEATVTFVRDPEGKPVELLGVTRDITDRRKAEEALRESEEKFRTLFEESKDGVFISTPDGRFVDINPAGVEMYGYSSKDELLQVDISKDIYVTSEHRETIKGLIEKNGFVKDYELTYRRKDGRVITVLETVTAVRDENGDIVAYRGLQRDVTEQKHLQEQLLQAQKMESIGTLAGGIAHDFNNLLGGILGYASLMKTKLPQSSQVYRYAETVEKSATRAAELTAQLLAFARGGKYETRIVDLNVIVNETLEIISRTFEKSIEIELHLDEELPTIEADAGQIQQVLMNLCVNARDAMSGRGALIIETKVEEITEEYIRTHMNAILGSYVVLSVTDTGHGMDNKILDRIFEPFFTTKPEGEGTGLGLSMVYGVVNNHNGYVRVYSELGEGTTFKIYLPVNGKPEAKKDLEREDVGNGIGTILVVDDEVSIRSLAKDILENYGYKVLLAEDGDQAVEQYARHGQKIDLVILDMVMPRMGGHETYLKLKEINPDINALLSTGYSQNGKAKEILKDGVMGFVQKPYNVQSLLSKVKSALDNNS